MILEKKFRQLEREHRAGSVIARQRAIDLLMIIRPLPPVECWWWLLEDSGLTPRQKKALKQQQIDFGRWIRVENLRARSDSKKPALSRTPARYGTSAFEKIAELLSVENPKQPVSASAVEESWLREQKRIKRLREQQQLKDDPDLIPVPSRK